MKTEISLTEYNNLPEEDKQLYAEVWQWYSRDYQKWVDDDNKDVSECLGLRTRQIYRLKPVEAVTERHQCPSDGEAPVKETVEEAAEKLFDRGSYKNDSQLQLTYLAGARFGANWQKNQDIANLKQQVIDVVDNMKIKTDKLTGPDRILNTILDEVISKIKEL